MSRTTKQQSCTDKKRLTMVVVVVDGIVGVRGAWVTEQQSSVQLHCSVVQLICKV